MCTISAWGEVYSVAGTVRTHLGPRDTLAGDGTRDQSATINQSDGGRPISLLQLLSLLELTSSPYGLFSLL